MVALDKRWTTKADPLTYSCNTDLGINLITVDYSSSLGLFPTGERPGCPSLMILADITTGLTDQQPTFTANLSVTTNGNGFPALSWDVTAADPQADGDNILFYRIYRVVQGAGGPPYTARIGRTNSGLSTSFTDSTSTVGDYVNQTPPHGTTTWSLSIASGRVRADRAGDVAVMRNLSSASPASRWSSSWSPCPS